MQATAKLKGSMSMTVIRADGRREHLGKFAGGHWWEHALCWARIHWVNVKLYARTGQLWRRFWHTLFWTPLVLAATVFTTVGKAFVIDKLDESVQTTPQYVGWGTGAGTAAVGDTTLFTEASESRVAGTLSQPSADTLRNVATLTADGTKTITNAGSFTASTSGTLFIKGDFTGVALLLNDQIQFTIDFQQT